jgi:DMSO/TMAO reductase YedYZ molybdopterin-dependent catalytic subunit
MSRMDRRSFLRTSALGVAAAAVYIEVPTLARAEESGTLVPLSRRPPNYESVRSTFTSRITSLDRFYLRHHFDAVKVDARAWRLEVKGLVEKPLSLSLADLEAMPQTTVEAVLQCAGNGRGLFEPRVPGVQWRFGAMGNARWTGVRLSDVLARARPKDGAAFLKYHGAERPTLPTTPPFVRAIPMARALHADTLIALQMNGKPLTPGHGAPARIAVPGWVADDWMKYVVELEVRADEPPDFYYATAYRYPATLGAPGAPVPADQMKPMTTLPVKSLIGSLEQGQVLRAGKREVAGVAFSGDQGIGRVEVSVDGGATWLDAALEGPSTPYGFRVFRLPWKAAPGRHVVLARATDNAGVVQPHAPAWNPSGYLYNAIDRVEVEVRS